MKQYSIKCPYCGAINKVYLEESEGWMECDQCLKNVNAYKILSIMTLPSLWSRRFIQRGV